MLNISPISKQNISFKGHKEQEVFKNALNSTFLADALKQTRVSDGKIAQNNGIIDYFQNVFNYLKNYFKGSINFSDTENETHKLFNFENDMGEEITIKLGKDSTNPEINYKEESIIYEPHETDKADKVIYRSGVIIYELDTESNKPFVRKFSVGSTCKSGWKLEEKLGLNKDSFEIVKEET